MFISDIILNSCLRPVKEELQAEAVGGGCKRDSMRCGDLLSEALMSWMTQGGTELGSGASSAPLCETSPRQPENCGQHEETALGVDQQLPRKEEQ